MNRLLVAALLLLAACYPKWKGPRTDHFDGKHFTNHPQQPTKGEFLKWRRGKNRGYWPDWVTQAAGARPTAAVQCDDLRVTFVNHNTMLLQIAILAWLFLEESLTWLKIAGMAIAGLGALIVQLRRPRTNVENAQLLAEKAPRTTN